MTFSETACSPPCSRRSGADRDFCGLKPAAPISDGEAANARVVAFAWGILAAVWEFMVTKGFMILLVIVVGGVVLAALGAVIAFIGRICRGK